MLKSNKHFILKTKKSSLSKVGKHESRVNQYNINHKITLRLSVSLF